MPALPLWLGKPELPKVLSLSWLGRLAEKNLVEKTLDKDNRSRLIVRCTRSGHEVCAGHNAFHQEHDKAFIDYLRQMDEVDFKAVCDFGQKLNSWMDGYLK